MINLFLAYDDNDQELGDYFEESYDNLLSETSNNTLVITNTLRGLDCSEANVNVHTERYKPNSFIFVAFSHGNEELLRTGNEIFISVNNCHFFSKSLFYTSACECAVTLGPQLMAKGCLAFVGYNGPVDVWEGYYEVFIECENYAIIEFMNSNKTIGVSFSEMKDKYNEAIDDLVLGNTEDKIVASLLVDNRDKLTLLGNADLVVKDFDN